jgi:rRNA-processing protein FCF1
MAKGNRAQNRPIALDTSVLMAPIEANVRPFEELDRLVPGNEAVVPIPVVTELEGLSGSHGEAGTAASVGLELASRCRSVETTATYADDAIVELATEGRVAYVATNDRELRNRVLSRDVPVIGLRGRDKLAVNRP